MKSDLASLKPRARRTRRRNFLVDAVRKSLTDSANYEVINRDNWSETKIGTFMHGKFIEEMRQVFVTLYPSQRPDTIEKKAKRAVVWEGDASATINYIEVFGMRHRPDFVIEAEQIKIAVEIKRGDSGSSVREGIGQSLLYSTSYDFVVYLIVDITKELEIKASINDQTESGMIHALWDKFNIRLEVA